MVRFNWLLGGGIAVLTLTGCPLSDEYFIDTDQASTGGVGGTTAAEGGKANGGGKGDAGTAGAACKKRPERCNGHDDDCNGSIDEMMVCNSSMGCTGFVLNLDSTHGYMFCSGRKTWTQARDACAMQDMLLASIGSEAENKELAQTLASLTADTEVTIGANDQSVEGDWVWDGGGLFWKGALTGTASGFVAWASTSPDNYNNGEDCAIINPSLATWADRNCAGTHVYVCEDRPQ